MRLAPKPSLLAPLILAFGMAPAFADQIIDLPGGVPTPVPGTMFTLMLSDITDQRCPSDADCYWEGMIRAEITVLSGTRAQTSFILCNLCDDGTAQNTIGGTTFTLGTLSPGRDVLDPLSRLITLEDYTLQVTASP